MKLFLFAWGLVYAYVIAESKDEALEKVRAPGSVARGEYPELNFDEDPDEEETSDSMIMHFGCD